MIDGIPEVDDFAGDPSTRTCPKCGAIMDHGSLSAQHDAHYIASRAGGWTNHAGLSAHACIACGYVELFTDPVTVRCLLAGVEPPRQSKKPGLL